MARIKDVTLYADDNDLIILPGTWRNFSGIEKQYNAKGSRNFNIGFSKDAAERLAEAGWNVKQRDPREEGDEPLYYMKVVVKFGKRPPKIVLITTRGQNKLDEDTVSELDFATIKHADIILHPFEWDINGSQGVTAYLNTLYAKIEENDLELKYGRYDPETGPNERIDVEVSDGERLPWED